MGHRALHWQNRMAALHPAPNSKGAPQHGAGGEAPPPAPPQAARARSVQGAQTSPGR